jgi:hypothetical protein
MTRTITARYALCRQGKWTSVGDVEFGMTLEEVELPGYAAIRAVQWSEKLKEDIYVHDQIRDAVPVIVQREYNESFDTRVCRHRRRMLRYERFDPLFETIHEVHRLTKVTQVLRSLRKAMRQHKVDRGETDGNGKLLLF